MSVCSGVCVGVCALGFKGREEAGRTWVLSLPLGSEVCLAFLSASISLSLSLCPSLSSCVCVSPALVGWDCLICRQIASVKNTRRKAEEVMTLGRGVGQVEGGPGGHSGEGV